MIFRNDERMKLFDFWLDTQNMLQICAVITVQNTDIYEKIARNDKWRDFTRNYTYYFLLEILK